MPAQGKNTYLIDLDPLEKVFLKGISTYSMAGFSALKSDGLSVLRRSFSHTGNVFGGQGRAPHEGKSTSLS